MKLILWKMSGKIFHLWKLLAFHVHVFHINVFPSCCFPFINGSSNQKDVIPKLLQHFNLFATLLQGTELGYLDFKQGGRFLSGRTQKYWGFTKLVLPPLTFELVLDLLERKIQLFSPGGFTQAQISAEKRAKQDHLCRNSFDSYLLKWSEWKLFQGWFAPFWIGLLQLIVF